MSQDVTLFDIFMIPAYYFFQKAIRLPALRTHRKCPYEHWQITFNGTAKISYGVVYRHRDIAEPDGTTPVFLFTVERKKWKVSGGSTYHPIDQMSLVETTCKNLAFDGSSYFLWDPEWGGVVVDLPPFFRVYQDWHEEILRQLEKAY